MFKMYLSTQIQLATDKGCHYVFDFSVIGKKEEIPFTKIRQATSVCAGTKIEL